MCHLRHEREARPEKLCLIVTVIAGRVEYPRTASSADSNRKCQPSTKAYARWALDVAQSIGWPYNEGVARCVVDGPEAG
jgi:hypothetical protein